MKQTSTYPSTYWMPATTWNIILAIIILSCYPIEHTVSSSPSSAINFLNDKIITKTKTNKPNSKKTFKILPITTPSSSSSSSQKTPPWNIKGKIGHLDISELELTDMKLMKRIKVRFFASQTRWKVYVKYPDEERSVKWFGREKKGYGTLSLFYNKRGDVLSGSATSKNHVYKFHTLPNKTIQITQIKSFPLEHSPLPSHSLPLPSITAKKQPPLDNINLMIIYTQRAMCLVAGFKNDNCPANPTDPSTHHHHHIIETEIKLAVAETNHALMRSGLSKKMLLVHTHHDRDYDDEERDYTKMLRDVQQSCSTAAGPIFNCHSLRKKHDADIVILVVHQPTECGISFEGLSGWTNGYAVVHWDCAVGNMSLGHIMGRLMGASSSSEEREMERGDVTCLEGNRCFNRAWRDPDGRFRSIMAVGDCRQKNKGGQRCLRVPIFSNKKMPFKKKTVGDEWHDNARWMEDGAWNVVVGYRSSAMMDGGGVVLQPPPPKGGDGMSDETKSGGGAKRLKSPFGGAISTYGNMFDIEAFRDVTITKFEVKASANTAVLIKIYSRPGSYKTHQNSKIGWTLILTVNYLIPAGTTTPTILPSLPTKLSIPSGTKRAFYVTSPNSIFFCGRGKNRDYVAKNDDAGVTVGTMNDVEEFGRSVGNYAWNGVVVYKVGGGGTTRKPTTKMPVGFPTLNPEGERSVEGPFRGFVNTYGNMFDINPFQDIMILSFDVKATTDIVFSVKIYTRQGTYKTHENSKLGWTLILDKRNIKSQGINNPTPLPPLPTPLPIRRSIKQSFYVYSTAPVFFCSRKPAGKVVGSNEDLELMAGSLNLNDFGSHAENYAWNGVLRYRRYQFTVAPTMRPTDRPTMRPTERPTNRPTMTPTKRPTSNPTKRPTMTPTKRPTNMPTKRPTMTPTKRPTNKPTNNPTKRPTNRPTNKPTNRPTNNPTNSPTRRPTNTPTNRPTNRPTSSPSRRPSTLPTLSFQPTIDLNTINAPLSGTIITQGNMFDIEAVTDMSILGFGVNVVTNDTFSVKVYTRQGTYKGSEQNAADWELILDENDIQSGRRNHVKQSTTTSTIQTRSINPTTLPLFPTPIEITAGSIQSFYVTSPAPVLYCGDGIIAGDVVVENDDVKIFSGSLNNFDFGPYFDNYVWNGKIMYQLERTAQPSHRPSGDPSSYPSMEPTIVPSGVPSLHPSTTPTMAPSLSHNPTTLPTNNPTSTNKPSSSNEPSQTPIILLYPSTDPTTIPSRSDNPTTLPSNQPSNSNEPSLTPSTIPSVSPNPSKNPSTAPSQTLNPSTSLNPSSAPSTNPTLSHTPTNAPVPNANWMSSSHGISIRITGGVSYTTATYDTNAFLLQFRQNLIPYGVKWLVLSLSSPYLGDRYLAPHSILTGMNQGSTPKVISPWSGANLTLEDYDDRDIFGAFVDGLALDGIRVIAQLSAQGPGMLKDGETKAYDYDDTSVYVNSCALCPSLTGAVGCECAPSVWQWRARVRSDYGSDDDETQKRAYAELIVGEYALKYKDRGLAGFFFDMADVANVTAIAAAVREHIPDAVLAFSASQRIPLTNNFPGFEDYTFGYPKSGIPASDCENYPAITSTENTAVDGYFTSDDGSLLSLGQIYTPVNDAFHAGDNVWDLRQAQEWMSRMMIAKGAWTWGVKRSTGAALSSIDIDDITFLKVVLAALNVPSPYVYQCETSPSATPSVSNMPTRNGLVSSNFLIAGSDGNILVGGNMFDIQATKTMNIVGIDVRATDDVTFSIQIYSRQGSYKDYEISESDWNLILDVQNVASQGSNGITSIPDFPNPIGVNVGTTRSFYVTSTSAVLLCTPGPQEGVLVSSNADINFYAGTLNVYRFDVYSAGYTFNGKIRYDTGNNRYRGPRRLSSTEEDLMSPEGGDIRNPSVRYPLSSSSKSIQPAIVPTSGFYPSKRPRSAASIKSSQLSSES